MNENKVDSVAIVGAGAMGAAYASMFAVAEGFSPFFLASGQRYERLSRERLIVNGECYNVPVRRPQEVAAPVDLLLVALKHHHLEEALPDIAPLVGPQTIVLSVMNGLQSELILAGACASDCLVYAIAVGIDAVREGGRFFYARPGRIIFGPGPQGGDHSDCLSRLGEALGRAGIPCEQAADIRRVMWWKFMINVGVNQASAVLRASYGIFQTSPDAMALMRLLMGEVILLAEQAGVNLQRRDLEEWLTVLATLSPEGKTSMLQDIEGERKTEVEIFAGEVVAMGREYGIPTPVNEAVLHIIRVMEASYLPDRARSTKQ